MYYPILESDTKIGDAQVSRAGLYYSINCRLHKAANGLYRINVCNGDHFVDLGICVPINGVLGIDTSIPVRVIGEGEMTFKLTCGQDAGEIIPISADVPVAYLSQHRKMRYVKANDVMGITLADISVNLPE